MYSHADRHHRRVARSVSRHVTDELVGVNNRVHREAGNADDRIDRLTLMCEAMWQLIEEYSDLELGDLEQRISELDAVDGWADLRRRRTAIACSCGAMVPVAQLACYFCGAEATPDSPFDMV